MRKISANFPWKIKTESKKQLYKCKILSGGKQIDVEYETIFTGTISTFRNFRKSVSLVTSLIFKNTDWFAT
jgi:hypothetical protein